MLYIAYWHHYCPITRQLVLKNSTAGKSKILPDRCPSVRSTVSQWRPGVQRDDKTSLCSRSRWQTACREALRNVTAPDVPSMPARNLAFPKPSSGAGSRPDVCVFVFTARRRRRRSLRTNQRRPGAGRARTVVETAKKKFHTHVHHSRRDGGDLRLPAELIPQMPGRGVKRKITGEGRSAVRHPVRASSLPGRSGSAPGTAGCRGGGFLLSVF